MAPWFWRSRMLIDVAHDKPPRPSDTDPPRSRSTISCTPDISAGFFSSTEARKTISEEIQQADAIFKTHTRDDSEPRAADVQRCFEEFRKQLEHAATLSESDRHKLLLDACQDSRPKVADTGEFSLLAHRLLSDTERNSVAWTDRNIMSLLNTEALRLPPIESLGAREMLKSFEKMSTASPDSLRGMKQLYKKYAKQIAGNPDTSVSADQDLNLRLLIRGLWDTGSFGHTLKSVQPRGDMIPASVQKLLHVLGQRLSDIQLRTHIGSILSDSTRAAVHIDSLVSTCASNPDSIPLGVSVLDHIPRRLLNTWMISLHKGFLKPEAKASELATEFPHFDTWMRMLRMLDTKATRASDPDLALQSLATLFKNHHHSRTSPRFVVIALLHVLAGHKSMAEISPDRLTSLTRSFAPTRRGHHGADLCLNDMLAALVVDLHGASLPNHGVFELMVPLLDQATGLKSVLDLLKRVQSNGSALSHTASLENYIANIVHRISQADKSSEHKRQHVALALRTCQHIQGLLTFLGANVDAQADALKGLQTRRQLQHIIHRARDAGIVPLTMRNVTIDLSKSTQTELIHQFAHQYSLDRTRNHRQNWLSIYYLYRYMRQHNIEIGPLFTKAVLRVCIIQPLSESQFVSSRRLKWVCELVARVEGIDAAKKIEHMFWEWRGDLILHAKSTLKAAGVGGRAHISTLKRLGMI